jgi:phosphate/sulfate permease
VVASGTDAVLGDGIVSKVIVPALVSPILAGAITALGVLVVYAMIKRFQEERAEREFRWAQVASSSMVALAHGTNDAQKTMGVISLALIANGNIKGGDAFDADLDRRCVRDGDRARHLLRWLADHQDARLADRFDACAANSAEALEELGVDADRSIAVAASLEASGARARTASISRSPWRAGSRRPSSSAAPGRTPLWRSFTSCFRTAPTAPRRSPPRGRRPSPRRGGSRCRPG